MESVKKDKVDTVNKQAKALRAPRPGLTLPSSLTKEQSEVLMNKNSQKRDLAQESEAISAQSKDIERVECIEVNEFKKFDGYLKNCQNQKIPQFINRNLFAAVCVKSAQMSLFFDEKFFNVNPHSFHKSDEMKIIEQVCKVINRISNNRFDFRISSILHRDELIVFITSDARLIPSESETQQLFFSLKYGVSSNESRPGDERLRESLFNKNIVLNSSPIVFHTSYSSLKVHSIYASTLFDDLGLINVKIQRIKYVAERIFRGKILKSDVLNKKVTFAFDPKYRVLLSVMSMKTNFMLSFQHVRMLNHDHLTLVVSDDLQVFSDRLIQATEVVYEENQDLFELIEK